MWVTAVVTILAVVVAVIFMAAVRGDGNGVDDGNEVVAVWPFEVVLVVHWWNFAVCFRCCCCCSCY